MRFRGAFSIRRPLQDGFFRLLCEAQLDSTRIGHVRHAIAPGLRVRALAPRALEAVAGDSGTMPVGSGIPTGSDSGCS